MVDTSDFIRDSRHRLEEEKGRLMRPWASGILPSDEGRAALHEEKREQQRQEYLAFLKSQTGHSNTPSLSRGFASTNNNKEREGFGGDSKRKKSISDLRQELSRDRDREIKTYSADHFIPSRHRERERDNYDRRNKERRNEREITTQRNREDEEEELSIWRDTRKRDSHSSTSAPILPGLGLKIKEETEREKRERQNQYRSELQAQMREKKQLSDANGRHFSSSLPPRRCSPELPRKPARERSPPLSPPFSPERGLRQRGNQKNVENYKYSDRHVNEHYEHNYYPPPPHFMPPYTTHGPYQSHAPFHQGHAPYYYPPYYPPPHHMGGGGPYHAPPTFTEGYPDEYSYRSRRHRSSPSPSERRRRSPALSNNTRRVKSPPTRSPSPPDREEEERLVRNRDRLKSILNKKTQKEKEREKFIKKMEAEVYDPWGRPGAGAPLTDATGNLVTERGLLRKSFDELSPRLSEEEKKRLQQEKQKEDLERQIKEKEEKALKEKLIKQQEDQNEEARIREEMNQLQIQAQYEKKKEKERGELKPETIPVKPETPLYSKQELAEIRFKEELEKKKRKEEEERKRLDRLADKLATGSSPFTYHSNNNFRSNSPPIPALAKGHTVSPPIPTLRQETTPIHDPPSHVITPSIHALPRPVITTPPNEVQHNIHLSPPRVMTPPINAPPSPPIIPSIYQTNCEPMLSSPSTASNSVIRLPVVEQGRQKDDILQNLSSLKDGLRRKLPHASPFTNSHTHTTLHPQTHTTSYPHTESYHINPHTHTSSNPYFHTTTIPQTHSVFPHTHTTTNPHAHTTFNPHTYTTTNSHAHTTFNPHTHTTTNSHAHTTSNVPPIRLRPSIPKGPTTSSNRAPPNSDTIDTFNKIKYAAPTSSNLSFWRQYPEPPRTNSDLEIQQDALLHHQRQYRDRVFPPLQEQHESQQRVSSSQSRATINTIDIESVAARNEERKRKLHSILNARRNRQENTVVQEEGEEQSIDGRHVNNDGRYDNGVLTSIGSNLSLDCETVHFQSLPTPPNVD